MMKILNSKKFFFTAFSILSVIGYGFVVFAAAPSGGYLPGQVLDPDCAPGDNDCIVTILNEVSQWDDVLGGINYAGGNVGIGTVTPSEVLDVVGTIQGTNLNITGNETTIATPTNISASFIYDNSYNYYAYNYPHNYRVYSYKDTGQGRVYSSSYLTFSSPTAPPPAAPTNLTVNQTCADGCNYYADGSVTHNFRVYSYKMVNDQRIYSTSYATLGSDFTDDNSNTSYDLTVSWDPVVGADGYRVLKYDPGYNGYNYDAGYDTTGTSIVDDGCGNICFDGSRSSVTTTSDIYDDNSTNQYGIELSWDPVVGADGYRIIIYDPYYNGYNYDAGYDTKSTSIIDDACGSVCFDGGLTDVGQTSAYTNVATINGQLTLTGPIVLNSTTLAVVGSNLGWNTDISGLTGSNNIFLGINAGNGATDASDSNFLGQSAGQNATNAYGSNFLGYSAGNGATSAYESNFLGLNAGYGATGAYQSNFLGTQAGYGATNAYVSNFFGPSAGYDATGASLSNFLGNQAGAYATNASNSNFLGQLAGYGATNAYDSNFLGQNAGNSAAGAYSSNFLGQNAGNSAAGAYSSNFLGQNAGYNATNASNSNFLGAYAGRFADNASNSNFFGNRAGHGATGASNANFIGANAGEGATSASNSNFFGTSSGQNAVSAYNSNFLGIYAGSGATYASNANFLGYYAGNGATGAPSSNFFGSSAGQGATNAAQSNFFGTNAGLNATGANQSNFFGPFAGISASNAYLSNFFGSSTGHSATNASYSNFFGMYAGYSATNANNANFLGQFAGQNATGANNSNFLGTSAGSGATSAYSSNFLGYQAGDGATGAYYSNFIGRLAGQGATTAYVSNFIGFGAGYLSTNAQQANFLGWSAGGEAPNTSFSNFMGREAGFSADNASNSNFLGAYAGRFADNASNSNFFGNRAGHSATGAYNSNFIGSNAGEGAANASNSTFIGKSAGNNDLVNNTGSPDDFSILIGNNTSTGGFSNSIALGGYATNTASNQFMIGSVTRPINDLTIVGTGFASCTIDIPGGTDAGGGTGTGISCSSDERLKTNIENLESTTLDTLLNVKTVRYNWSANPTGNKSIGFLAQDLQQYFPELVKTGHDGYLQVNYGGITPILVEAIREMNLKITTINDMTTPNTWRDSLIAWFENASNGIQRMFIKEVYTDMLCVGQTCLNEAQVQQILQTIGSQGVIPTDNPVSIPDENTPENTAGSSAGEIDPVNESNAETNVSSPVDEVSDVEITTETDSANTATLPDIGTELNSDTGSI